MIENQILERIRYCIACNKMVTFLAGAGISADSGIPTFRGKDGFWVSGSENYQAEDIATFSMFQREPDTVWKWYLFRKAIMAQAKPNQGHFMLKEIGDLLGNRFALISQNVDNLHKKAGNKHKNIFHIHGTLDLVRCANGCSGKLSPFPKGIKLKNRNNEVISKEEWQLLTCRKCGALLRPHVLWFDEYYDEEYYRIETVMEIAGQTGLLICLGTTGVTTLPQMVCQEVLENNQMVVDVNIERTPLSDLVDSRRNGLVVRQRSSDFLTALKNEILNTQPAAGHLFTAIK